MQSILSVINAVLGSLCLITCLVLIAFGFRNQDLQNQAIQQQTEIRKGQISRQIGTAIVKDMATVSVKNEAVKALLKKYGYDVKVQPQSKEEQKKP